MNAVLTTAAAIFKLAVRRKLATGNPAADAERAFMGATELKDEATKEQRGDGVQPLRPEEVLDPNEIRKVLEKAEPGYYRTLFLTAYLTGMRSGELFRAAMVGHRAQGNRRRRPARNLRVDEFSFAARSHGLA